MWAGSVHGDSGVHPNALPPEAQRAIVCEGLSYRTCSTLLSRAPMVLQSLVIMLSNCIQITMLTLSVITVSLWVYRAHLTLSYYWNGFFVILVFRIWLPKLGIVQGCLIHFSEASLSLNSHNVFCYRSMGIILFVVFTIVSICENSRSGLFSFTPMVRNSKTWWMAGQIIEHSERSLGVTHTNVVYCTMSSCLFFTSSTHL